ncbi:ATP-binding cassette domain-containing protein [Kibdelosporangium aridum]|uniref:ATP-binding cassette, subfamily B n=1 Tax=Kibdelosporangium aridum TaxID=2030 RepID=A0A1W2FYR1_KIBAR|nr:ABC transporter ATP-binding protein [Kibdelosporangium aridum]SMD26924.1 ATP-binding cassette, subfamily B [Kibdelosporangium aridum]
MSVTATRATFAADVLRLVRRIRPLYVFSASVWTLIHGLPLLVGVGIELLFDRAATNPADPFVWWMLALTVGSMVLRSLLLFGGLNLDFTLIFRTSAHVKTTVIDAVSDRSTSHGPAVGNGDVLNRLRDDSDEIAEFLSWTADFVYRTVLLIIALTVLLTTDVLVTLSLLPLLGALWVAKILKNRLSGLSQDTRARQGRIAEQTTDLITGIRDLRLAGVEQHRVDRLAEQFTGRRRAQARQQVVADLLGGMFRNIVVIGSALVLMTASARMASGDFTVGELALFLTYTSWLAEQIFFFGRALARYEQGRVSRDRLLDVVAGLPGLIKPPAPAEVAPVGLQELRVREFQCVPKGRDATPPIELDLRPGQMAVITGAVGSGKSTALRGLLALDGPTRGSVRWNDTDVTGDQAWWRAPNVAYARQSAAFFRGTVRDNLALGSDAVDDELAVRALTAVQLRPGSAELPDGLDTEIGSGGTLLSGGQRQRLALARMLCRPAQLYLVDDCDSSLDGDTARAVWTELVANWPAAWIVASHNRDVRAMADVVVHVGHGTDR